ncbi:MAG: 3-phosphoshikimate 1-carboxyvinyltransferase [Candidatus Omnitrophica bacterium]|nr:3-phosphoshikimate 1-carboxyvinyltransferase [Candidatus Omnitrophota bacterium]
MSSFKIQGPCRIKGRISLPGDKSIAHRFVFLGSISRNLTVIKNFPFNDDCISTAKVFKKLGAQISYFPREKLVKILGKGLRGLKKPDSAIFVGESGTTLRLLLGVLSGQSFKTRLICAKSLSRRPMLRVTRPLREMGARIFCRKSPQGEEYPPITIAGSNLKSIKYKMPIASAQVKSAILLAGLYAQGVTRVIEPVRSRDHTERLLKAFRADIKVLGRQVSIRGKKELISAGSVYVPGDISSAAFFLVLATILINSKIVLKNCSLNPTRAGVIEVLKRMGADIKVTRHRSRFARFEPMGDIEVRSSRLKGTIVKRSEIPSLIDELPILMVAASFAQGKSRLEGVGELRVKETDRIKSMQENLRKMGADIQVTRSQSHYAQAYTDASDSVGCKVTSGEDIVIQGGFGLKGAKVKSFGDHRTAMSMIVAGLAARGITTIDDTICISKSFPDFLKVLKSIIK